MLNEDCKCGRRLCVVLADRVLCGMIMWTMAGDLNYAIKALDMKHC